MPTAGGPVGLTQDCPFPHCSVLILFTRLSICRKAGSYKTVYLRTFRMWNHEFIWRNKYTVAPKVVISLLLGRFPHFIPTHAGCYSPLPINQSSFEIYTMSSKNKSHCHHHCTRRGKKMLDSNFMGNSLCGREDCWWGVSFWILLYSQEYHRNITFCPARESFKLVSLVVSGCAYLGFKLWKKDSEKNRLAKL